MSPWKSTSFLYWFLGAGKPWISHIASGSRLLFPGFHFWDGLGNNIGKSKDMWKCMQMYLSNKQCCIYIYIYIYNVHIYNMFIYFIHIDFLHITNNSGLWGSWKPRNTCPAISFHQRTLKEKPKPGTCSTLWRSSSNLSCPHDDILHPEMANLAVPYQTWGGAGLKYEEFQP